VCIIREHEFLVTRTAVFGWSHAPLGVPEHGVASGFHQLPQGPIDSLTRTIMCSTSSCSSSAVSAAPRPPGAVCVESRSAASPTSSRSACSLRCMAASAFPSPRPWLAASASLQVGAQRLASAVHTERVCETARARERERERDTGVDGVG
jgi:hypothetical protein